ncbi:MAG TPA: hypothetical protein PLL69_06380, partial [Gemmatimonadales bacterium]|nr:hypothetical protein [Gemmatimonadales bacterium]
MRLSGGISRAFEATGVVAGIGVLPWTIADGKAVRFRAGVDGWLSYAEVTSKPGAHRTMWGVGPMVELSIPAAGTPTSIYTRAAIHIASS